MCTSYMIRPWTFGSRYYFVAFDNGRVALQGSSFVRPVMAIVVSTSMDAYTDEVNKKDVVPDHRRGGILD